MAHETDSNDDVQSSTGEMSYDDYLKYSGRSSGGGFLKKWTEEGQIDVWLPPGLAPQPRWSHRFIHMAKGRPKDARPDDDEIDMIYSFRWGCLEREPILRKQRFRNDDGGAFVNNGSREHPPEDCPYDLFLEWVRDEIRAGRMDWMDTLFKIETDDDERIIRAGGFTGLIRTRKEKLTSAQREDMRRHDIDQSKAYMEDGSASLDFLIRCVEFNDPAAGILKTTVGDSLGQLIQNEIRNRITVTARSRKPFDPRRDWLCLRWIYNEKEIPSKRYDVITMTEEEPNEAVIESLRDVPSIADDLRKGDPRELLEKMKAAIVPGITPPWDELFGPACERAERKDPFGKSSTSTKSTPKAPPTPPKSETKAPPKEAPKTKDPAPSDDDNSGMVACDVCEKPFPDTELECPHCKSRYDPRTFKVVFNGPEEERKKAEAEAAKGKGAAEDPTPKAPARRRPQPK